MKSLSTVINESLQGITISQYKGIWKGNFNVDLNKDHLDNPTYFFTELLYSHKQNLPTTEEFANVCKFVVSKMKHLGFKYVDKYFNEFCNRFVEIFFPELFNYSQNNGKILFSHGRKHIDFVITLNMIFYGVKFKQQDKYQDRDKLKLNTCIDILNRIGEKYGLNADTWPDYTVGLNILINALENK